VTGTTVPLAVGFPDDQSVCLARTLFGDGGTAGALWSRPSSETGTAADDLIDSGLGSKIFAASPRRGPEASAYAAVSSDHLQQQIIRAVFVRAAALSVGEPAAEEAARREVARGNTLVPILAERLRAYEMHRDKYPTLLQFLPELIKGITDPGSNSSAEVLGCSSPGAS
jgi:hypothetical protein